MLFIPAYFIAHVVMHMLQSDNEVMDEVLQDPSLLEPKPNEVAKEPALHLPEEDEPDYLLGALVRHTDMDMLFILHLSLSVVMHMLQSDSEVMDKVVQDASFRETYIFQLQLHHAMIPLKSLKNCIIQDFTLSKSTLKLRNDPYSMQLETL